MGTSFSREPVKAPFKVELFKWSSSQFPEEYALVYTSHMDDSYTCTFRLSAKRDKVLCLLSDDMCDEDPVRFQVEFSAVKDNNNGNFKCGEPKVQWTCDDEILKERQLSPREKTFTYCCPSRGKSEFLARELDCYDRRCETAWVVAHIVYHNYHSTSFHCPVNVRCDKGKGFCVELCGPDHKYVSLSGRVEWAPLYVDRKVNGEPPKPNPSNNAIVKAYKFKEENDISQLGSSMLPPNGGLITNVGGHYRGNFGGSIFNNCNINEKP